MNFSPKVRSGMLIMTVILFVLVIGFTVGGRERISIIENALGNLVRPVQVGFSKAGAFLSERIDPVVNIWSTYKRNGELEAENELLKRELISQTLTKQEYTSLKNLRKALNYVHENNISYYITADVISKDAGNWYNMFVINIGTKNGITKQSMVYNGEGLIGMVYEVGEDWSKVITIVDNKSSVGFEILDVERNFDGKISGSVSADLSGELFDPQAVVYIGDRLITSGLGVYPKGIFIGVVKEIIEDKDSLLKHIIVEPAVNFKKIDRVFVIPKLNTFTE